MKLKELKWRELPRLWRAILAGTLAGGVSGALLCLAVGALGPSVVETLFPSQEASVAAWIESAVLGALVASLVSIVLWATASLARRRVRLALLFIVGGALASGLAGWRLSFFVTDGSESVAAAVSDTMDILLPRDDSEFDGYFRDLALRIEEEASLSAAYRREREARAAFFGLALLTLTAGGVVCTLARGRRRRAIRHACVRRLVYPVLGALVGWLASEWNLGGTTAMWGAALGVVIAVVVFVTGRRQCRPVRGGDLGAIVLIGLSVGLGWNVFVHGPSLWKLAVLAAVCTSAAVTAWALEPHLWRQPRASGADGPLSAQIPVTHPSSVDADVPHPTPIPATTPRARSI